MSIAILRVWPNPSATAILVDKFDDRDDLIRAIHASCFVPGYLKAALTTDWRGLVVVDGGLVDMVPVAPPGVTKVNPFAFHPKLFGGATVRSRSALIKSPPCPRLAWYPHACSVPPCPRLASQCWAAGLGWNRKMCCVTAAAISGNLRQSPEEGWHLVFVSHFTPSPLFWSHPPCLSGP